MTALRPLRFVSLALAAALIALLPASAQRHQEIPGPHPHYLHALSDLRYARALLADNWGYARVQAQDQQAVAEIDAAIHAIKGAQIDDGKGLNAHPPIDAPQNWRGRFAKANQLLASARNDVDKAEDWPQARGLRNTALTHIDAAQHIVDHAWRTARWESGR